MADARVGVLVMAYGTPATHDDIEPYYTDIRRGRPPTPELLSDLIRRYDAIGGISPLAALTEAQRAGIERALDTAAPGGYAVALGTKHADPKIEAGVEELIAKGCRHIVGLVLAPHYSAMSVGEYHGRARAKAAESGIGFTGIEHWHVIEPYVDFLAGAVRDELQRLPEGTKVLFTAHSLPERIVAQGDPYPDELRATGAAVAAKIGLAPWTGWSTAYQSAGRTPEPWLGPDVLAVIDDLAAEPGATGLLVCACGFVSDHLELLYDLDIEAAGRARERGIAFARTRALNDDPTVMAALAELVRQAV
ncbi:MAG: ferrochelatase [Acidimicrobiia bacterium]